MTKQSPTDQFIAINAETVEMLKRMLAHAEDHQGKNPETIGYGDVGDAGNNMRAIREISDRMFCEGEYE